MRRYGHAGTVTLLITTVPKEWQVDRTYHERGWPTFERAVSSLIKKAAHCLDMGAAPHLARKGPFKEKDVKQICRQAEGKGVSAGGLLSTLVRGTRSTPLPAEVFTELVLSRRFSNPKDAERVPMLRRDDSTTEVSSSVVLGQNRGNHR